MKKPPSFKPNFGTGKKFVKKRLYETTNWIEFRNKFIQANPKCYCCDAAARIVDHWKPFKGDEKLFWDELNYIPLCKAHHDFCTGKFDRHTPPLTIEKLEWLNNMRLENGVTRKVKVVSTTEYR